jgi:malate/lactate dehydrogenase
LANSDRVVTGTGDYADTAVVVIVGIVRAVARDAVKRSPGCVLVVAANPVNTMAQLAYEVRGLPRERVIDVSGALKRA